MALNHAPGGRRAQRWARRHKTAADSADRQGMLSIAHVWSFLIHVPFLGGALILLVLWKLIENRLPRPKARR